ncbi:MAG: hypothetical protein NTY20_03460 [Candidatus Aenigmarchaeota archaeon]|nr:hypothetical protein [Candidatus Aenigmarchaeota archaeon]
MEPEEKKEEHEHHEHEKKEHEAEHEKEHHEQHEKKEEEKHHEHAHEKEESEKEGGKATFKHESQLPASGEKKDLRDSRISILVFILAGAAMALLSSLLKFGGISSWITGTIGIVLLIVLASGMTKMFRRKLKFFYAGLFVYLLIWLVFWIFLFNI